MGLPNLCTCISPWCQAVGITVAFLWLWCCYTTYFTIQLVPIWLSKQSLSQSMMLQMDTSPSHAQETIFSARPSAGSVGSVLSWKVCAEKKQLTCSMYVQLHVQCSRSVHSWHLALTIRSIASIKAPPQSNYTNAQRQPCRAAYSYTCLMYSLIR